MMTNERQITVYHLYPRRYDRQFNPYRRPAGYVRFSSVPQISAKRQYLMTFMVVSRRDVTATSPKPALAALGLWSQEEATCRILSGFSYCYIVRRDRRYHPYKRPGKYFNRRCRKESLPFYLNYRYFSASVQRYLNDSTAANTAAGKETEVESLSKDKSTVDPKMTHSTQIAILKPPEMTTPELDVVPSVDVSHPIDTPVRDSLTDWGINLLTDSDLQQKREWECETYVKDLNPPAQSKATTDVNITCFDDKQGNNVAPRDNFSTSNVPKPETQEKEIAGPSETDVKQPDYEETDNEDDLLQIDPCDGDLCDSAHCLSESSINQLLDIKKTKDTDFEPLQSVMEEKQVNSDELLNTFKPTVTKDEKRSIKEPEVYADLHNESKSIENRHKNQQETKLSPGKTQEVSSDKIATVKDIKEYSRKSEKENVALKTEGQISSDAAAGYDANQSCDMETILSTKHLQSNFINSTSYPDTMTTVSVSAKAGVEIENKQEQLSSKFGETAKNNGFEFDKLQNYKKYMENAESDTIFKPKVPRMMYINPAMIAQLTKPDNKCEEYPNFISSKDNPSTKQSMTTSEYTSSKRVLYLNPSKQSKPISGEKETGLLLNGQCENPTVTPTKFSNDSNKNSVKKTTIELCNGNTKEKQVMNDLRQTKVESTDRRIISLNPSKNRKSAAVFFKKEMNSKSETSDISIFTNGNTASFSTRRVICLRPNKNLKSSNPQGTDPIKAKDRELHSNNSLSMWLRHGSVSSELNQSKQKLSDEERLKMRKRRFGTTSSNHQTTPATKKKGV